MPAVLTAVFCAVVSVSAAEVGVLCVLHINFAPLGVVLLTAKLPKFTVGVGQLLVAVVGVTAGAVVPATQGGIPLKSIMVQGGVICTGVVI